MVKKEIKIFKKDGAQIHVPMLFPKSFWIVKTNKNKVIFYTIFLIINKKNKNYIYNDTINIFIKIIIKINVKEAIKISKFLLYFKDFEKLLFPYQ